MRSVSDTFIKLFNEHKPALYQVEYGAAQLVISNDQFKRAPSWVDAHSDDREYCVGNCFMGTCKFASYEQGPDVGDPVKLYISYDAQEWVLIGSYTVDKYTHNHKMRQHEYECIDNMHVLDTLQFNIDAITFPITYGNMVDIIYAATVITIVLPDFNRDLLISGFNTTSTARDVLAEMLLTIGYNARCSPAGDVLCYLPYQPAAAPAAIASESEYDQLGEISKPITGITLENSLGEIYTVGDATGLMLDVFVQWGKQSHAFAMLDALEGYVHHPVFIGKAIVNPALEPGDTVQGRVSGELYVISHISNRGGAMPRADLSHGLWKQYKIGRPVSKAYQPTQDYPHVVINHIPSQEEVDSYRPMTIVLVYDDTSPYFPVIIEITGPDIIAPNSTAQYTAVVKDIAGVEMVEERVQWDLDNTSAPISIDAVSGELTVGDATPGTIVRVWCRSITNLLIAEHKEVAIQ